MKFVVTPAQVKPEEGKEELKFDGENIRLAFLAYKYKIHAFWALSLQKI